MPGSAWGRLLPLLPGRDCRRLQPHTSGSLAGAFRTCLFLSPISQNRMHHGVDDSITSLRHIAFLNWFCPIRAIVNQAISLGSHGPKIQRSYSHLAGVNIGSDNGLLPERCQAIIYNNAKVLLTGPLTSMELYSKFINVHRRKCIWKCRLQNGVYIVSASMC